MSVHRSVVVAAATVILLASAQVVADPTPSTDTVPMASDHLRLLTGPGVLLAPNGLHILLPIGTHIVADDKWEALDVETRRLQDQETRLGAENKSLRESADGWQPGWKTLAVTIVSGVVAGWYIHDKF